MMMNKKYLDELLIPSLNNDDNHGVPFSVFSHVLVAWFGGPLAIVGFSMLCANNMNRLKSRSWFFVILTILAMFFLGVSLAVNFGIITPPDLLNFESNRKAGDFLLKIGAICLFGIFYLNFRQQFLASSYNTISVTSALKPGLIFVVLGISLNFLITFIYYR